MQIHQQTHTHTQPLFIGLPFHSQNTAQYNAWSSIEENPYAVSIQSDRLQLSSYKLYTRAPICSSSTNPQSRPIRKRRWFLCLPLVLLLLLRVCGWKMWWRSISLADVGEGGLCVYGWTLQAFLPAKNWFICEKKRFSKEYKWLCIERTFLPTWIITDYIV